MKTKLITMIREYYFVQGMEDKGCYLFLSQPEYLKLRAELDMDGYHIHTSWVKNVMNFFGMEIFVVEPNIMETPKIMRRLEK